MLRNYTKVLLLLQIIVLNCSANENILIRDYFTYKNVGRFVGFSCGNTNVDVKLVKLFSDVYKYAGVSNFRSSTRPPTDLKRFLNADFHRLGIFIDLRCDDWNVTARISEVLKHDMYDEMHKWLILSTDLRRGIDMIDDSKFNVQTDVVLAIPSSNGYVLYDVYNIWKSHDSSLNVTLLGTWHEGIGLYMILPRHKFGRRSNMHGKQLRVGVLIDKQSNLPLDELLQDRENKLKDNHTKYLYAILLHIAQLYNFTIKIVEIDPWKKRGNHDPIFTALIENNIDLCANPTTMTAERLNYGDVIASVWPIRTCFLFRTISSTKMRTSQFIKPFSTKVWYSMLIILGAAAFFLLIISKLEGINGLTDRFGLSALFAVGAISQQALVFVPTGLGGRIVFLQIFFFSLLLFNYYSASVVSGRLRNIGENTHDSVISLADSSFEIAMEPTKHIDSLLQEPHLKSKYFNQKHWLKLLESTKYLSIEEGLNRVAEGGFAYYTLTESAYPYIEKTFENRMICELTEIHVLQTVLALWARNNSPLTELLRVGLTRMHNMGLRDRQLKRWSARKPRCPSNMLIAEALSIHEAAPFLMFLGLGMTIATSICLAENLVYWFLQNRLPLFGSKLKQLSYDN